MDSSGPERVRSYLSKKLLDTELRYTNNERKLLGLLDLLTDLDATSRKVHSISLPIIRFSNISSRGRSCRVRRPVGWICSHSSLSPKLLLSQGAFMCWEMFYRRSHMSWKSKLLWTISVRHPYRCIMNLEALRRGPNVRPNLPGFKRAVLTRPNQDKSRLPTTSFVFSFWVIKNPLVSVHNLRSAIEYSRPTFSGAWCTCDRTLRTYQNFTKARTVSLETKNTGCTEVLWWMPELSTTEEL